jgi:hypothetical protein
MSSIPKINNSFSRLVFVIKLNNHLQCLLVDVSHKCDLGAAFGYGRLINADLVDFKVRSLMLRNWRNAAMQFCVIRSVVPSHSMGCEWFCASQEYDSLI